MISTLLDRLFQRQNITSGTQVKQRLKFILAHDRAAIEPQVFDNMRYEIMRVVSKYVELDEGSLDIRLESDKRMTALIANLPIKMVREELPDLVALFDEPEEINLVNDSAISDPLAIEMAQFADAALDAIAAKENTLEIVESPAESSLSENIVALTEHTTEITSKLRTAANKSKNYDEKGDRAIAEIEVKEVNKDSAPKTSEEHHQSSSLDENETIEDKSSDNSDQLELSLDLSSETEEVVVEQSAKTDNQSHQ